MKLPTDPNPPFVAVVTGSSSGIGRAIAREFAARGAYVLLHCRSHVSGLADSVRDARRVSPREMSRESGSPGSDSSRRDQPEYLRCAVADVQSPSSRWELVRMAFAWQGYVNTWVHAAGADVLTGDAASAGFSEKLASLWKTDVEGALHLSRRIAQEMQSRPLPHPLLPSIVHLGWDQADQGMEGDSGQFFAATKAAVAAFSKSLAKSFAPRVRVNCVAPGWIQTDWGQTASEAWDRRAREESLLQRWGTVDDVARFVASISMGDAEFVNGQTLSVNGGWAGTSNAVRSRTDRDLRTI